MGYCLADIPASVWDTVEWEILRDDGSTTDASMRIEVWVKTKDELQELIDKINSGITKDIADGKRPQPHDDLHMRFVWSLLKDWEGFTDKDADGKELNLKYNRTNFKKLVGYAEARQAIHEKVKRIAYREDLLEKN